MKTSDKRKLATSFTVFVFIVISVTGVFLYLHMYKFYLRSLHEILGLAFIAIALLHVWYNFNSMKKYFTNKTFLASGVLVSIISAYFILSVEMPKGPGAKQVLYSSLLNAPKKHAFIVLAGSEERARKILKEKKLKFEEQESIKAIAKANELRAFSIMRMLYKSTP